ncbi:MAG: AAA family ATPase [Lachnospiraceae bacterium]|nr:AAA family ATPase [Lachnospiraceae bacterium]
MKVTEDIIATGNAFMRDNEIAIRSSFGNYAFLEKTGDMGEKQIQHGDESWVNLKSISYLAAGVNPYMKQECILMYLIGFKMLPEVWSSKRFAENEEGICYCLLGLQCVFSKEEGENPQGANSKMKVETISFFYKENCYLDVKFLKDLREKKEFPCRWNDMDDENKVNGEHWKRFQEWIPLEKEYDIDTIFGDDIAYLDDVPSENEEEEEYRRLAEKLDNMDSFLDSLKKNYRFAEKDIRRLQSYMNYCLQTSSFSKIDKAKKMPSHMPYLNLLIHSNDSMRSMDFVREISGFLKEDRVEIVTFSQEKERDRLIQSYEGKNPPRIDGLLRLRENSIVVIKDCIEKPLVDKDAPTGFAVQNNTRSIRAYEDFWRIMGDACRLNHNKLFFILADDTVFQDLAYNCTEIFYRIFNTHIFIPDYSVDELYEKCLQEMHKNGFTLAEGFDKALKRYLQAVYNRAELKGSEFVTDLLNRIYVNYFRKNHGGKEFDCIITEEYIPFYRDNISGPEVVLNELDSMTGLGNVKEEFHSIYNGMAAGLDKGRNGWHMFFVGNPGTGKTTVARLAARLFHGMGVLKTDNLVETRPGDFVSPWRGNTEQRALAKIREAYDGVLFIDEAYGFNSDDDKYESALAVLIKEMEDHADRLVVIFAGYEEDMNALKKINQGLASRLRKVVYFEDYSEEELKKILNGFLRKEDFELAKDSEELVETLISAKKSERFFGNARVMRAIASGLAESWAEEFLLAKEHGQVLNRVIGPSCVEKLLPEKDGAGIDGLIGLTDLKNKLAEFKNTAAYQHFLKERGVRVPATNMHMIFAGSPGTGKTTVAKMLAKDLYKIGVLKTDKCIVVEKKDLVNYSKNMTPAQHAEEYVKEAIGGILFVDEAYSLVGSSGQQIIEVFLTAMEDYKENTIFVFAGYSYDMQEFVSMNSGLTSRISYVFHFEDYTVDELTEIFYKKMEESRFVIKEGVDSKIREVLEYFQAVPDFGNGRFVDQLISQTIGKRAARAYDEKDYSDIDVQDIPTVGDMLKTSAQRKVAHDPGKVTDEDRRRTAVHELGHAIMLLQAGSEHVPESISIKSVFGSYGRVELNPREGNMTESDYLNHVATLLSGKNAEIAFFGEHASGCSSDYQRAKRVCKMMVKNLAMGTIGKTKPKDLLIRADEMSMKVIQDYKPFMDSMVDILLEKKSITGEELKKEFDVYLKKAGIHS